MGIFSLILLFSLFETLSAQVPVPTMEDKEYPAASEPETRLEAALASFFEDTEVGNLHVFASGQDEADEEFYFHGTELPDSFLPSFEEGWRNTMPENIKPFAVFIIRGYEEPYYIIRFQGEGLKNAIELFEMVNGTLTHRLTLARLWCTEGQCIQEDAWIQDVDGDTLLDVLKKVRIFEGPELETTLSEYQTLYVQDDDGTYFPTSSIPVEWEDYQMEPFSEMK